VSWERVYQIEIRYPGGDTGATTRCISAGYAQRGYIMAAPPPATENERKSRDMGKREPM
jgi:hypothetical protein